MGMKPFYWKSALFMVEARLYSGCALRARIQNLFDHTAPKITDFGLESRSKTNSVIHTPRNVIRLPNNFHSTQNR